MFHQEESQGMAQYPLGGGTMSLGWPKSTSGFPQKSWRRCLGREESRCLISLHDQVMDKPKTSKTKTNFNKLVEWDCGYCLDLNHLGLNCKQNKWTYVSVV
ncbi:hypothetical protein GOODEAATRI_029532 [Goodea atripinnis]|uniref:Uncharacterized protein n=1 Tax=Goodea atripinnis TaxID=208336 RepID=A0ABV0N577_9TELE